MRKLLGSATPARARAVVPPLAVAVLAVLAFAAVVPGGRLVFDDHVLIEKNTDLQQGDVWWRSFTRDYYATSARAGDSGYYRPLAVVANAVDMRLWGRRAAGYHRTNLALHALASVALGPALVALEVPAAVAWTAAALFAIHPAHAESVAFVSGRVDVLAALGVFAALGWAGSRARLAWMGAGVAALVAYLSKESAVVLPILLFLLWMARPADEDARRGAPAWVLVAVAVGTATLVALVLRYAALGSWLPASAQAPRAGHPVLLPVRALLFALASLFAPVRRLVMEPDPAQLGALRLAAGFLVGVGLWVAAWRADRAARRGLVACLLAGAVALLPVLDILPQETALSERFLYLASGFWLVPAAVLMVAGWRLGGNLRPLAVGSAGLACVLLLGIAAWRARAWRDDLVLWRIAVSEEPERAAFWDRLGLAHTERKQFAMGEAALRRAVELDPRSFNAQLNLGVLLQSSRRSRLAIEAFTKALEMNPKHVNAHLNLGLSLLDMGDFPKAYEQFTAAAALKPDNPDALRLAGGTAMQLGRLVEARRYLEEAQRLLPQSRPIRQALDMLAEREKRQAAPRPRPAP